MVSGPAKRRLASRPVRASGEKLARSSRKMRISSVPVEVVEGEGDEPELARRPRRRAARPPRRGRVSSAVGLAEKARLEPGQAVRHRIGGRNCRRERQTSPAGGCRPRTRRPPCSCDRRRRGSRPARRQSTSRARSARRASARSGRSASARASSRAGSRSRASGRGGRAARARARAPPPDRRSCGTAGAPISSSLKRRCRIASSSSRAQRSSQLRGAFARPARRARRAAASSGPRIVIVARLVGALDRRRRRSSRRCVAVVCEAALERRQRDAAWSAGRRSSVPRTPGALGDGLLERGCWRPPRRPAAIPRHACP